MTEESAPDVPPVGDERLSAYVALKEENHKRFQSLRDKGVPIPGVLIANQQLEALLDLLGEEARSAWAFLFEHRIKRLLDDMEPEADSIAARQKLLAASGEPIANRLLKP